MTCPSGSAFVYADEWFAVPGRPGVLAATMLGLHQNDDPDAPYLMRATDFDRVVIHSRNVHSVKLMSSTSGFQYSVVKIHDESFDVIKVKPHHHCHCCFNEYASEKEVERVEPPPPPPKPPPPMP